MMTDVTPYRGMMADVTLDAGMMTDATTHMDTDTATPVRLATDGGFIDYGNHRLCRRLLLVYITHSIHQRVGGCFFLLFDC